MVKLMPAAEAPPVTESPAKLEEQIRELVAQRARLDFEKLIPLRREHVELLDRIHAAVEPWGLTATQFLTMTVDQAEHHIIEQTHQRTVGTPMQAKPKMKVPPKYRNPKNREQLWTGRGAQPIWVRDFLAAGGDINTLLIDKKAAKTKGKTPAKGGRKKR